MQRWIAVIALVAITLLAAMPANAFHHGRHGCGYGGCGYAGYGYGGCGGGWCGAGPYAGYAAPYAWGGYRPYGYAAYPMMGSVGYGPYGGVVYSGYRPPVYSPAPVAGYYAPPGYSTAIPGYVPLRPNMATGAPARNGTAVPKPSAPTSATAPAAASPSAIAQRP